MARTRRPRWPWALVCAGLLAGLGTPVHADQSPAVTLSIARLWNQGGSVGSWTPYQVTVRNAGAGTFAGTAALVPNPTRGPIAAGGFPDYQAAVDVPAGRVRTLTAYTIEPNAGYHAELRDDQGRLVTTADPAPAGGSGAAVAVLSDQPHAEQRIGALLRSPGLLDATFSGLASARAVPSDVVRLSGLNALIVDQFDSGSLGQAQRRALADFVGLGGTLVEVAGAGAGRTLGPLPAEVLPLRPTGVATADLAALADLGGLAAGASAQVATGDLASGARVAVAAADGTPLVVESDYGAGTVVELTFDPLAAPFDTRLDLAATAWTQALSRGLGRALGGSSQLGRLAFGGGLTQGGPPHGSGPGAASGFAGYLYQVLNDAPATPSPPFGLLAVLLAVYVVLVSAVVYAALRAAGRRGLLWVAVPAIAIACTTGAYAVGIGARGSDYQLAQVQVERLAPGGVVETSAFDGVLSPRRGDVDVTAPDGALVSTATPLFGSSQDGTGQSPAISIGPAARVTFTNVAVWDMRPVQTLAVSRLRAPAATAMPVDARLGIRAGRLVGQVTNHTGQAIADLQLVSPSGAQSVLTALLQPGATRSVDAALDQGAPGLPLGKGVIVGPAAGTASATNLGPVPPRNGAQAMVALAASEVAIRPGEWALVGAVAPARTLQVSGQQPARSGRAMIVEPARLTSADSLAAGAPPADLVSAYADPASGGVVDVYELDVPAGLTKGVGLSAALTAGASTAGAPPVDVYDWDQRSWQALPRIRPGAGPSSPVALTPGELHGPAVRARVAEESVGQTTLTLADTP